MAKSVDFWRKVCHNENGGEVMDNSTKISEEEVKNVLIELGVPVNVRGYRYLVSSIVGVTRDPAWKKLTLDVYADIAKEYGKSSGSVEKNIRYAIAKSLDSAPEDKIREVFGVSNESFKDGITASRYIYGISEYIKRRNI